MNFNRTLVVFLWFGMSVLPAFSQQTNHTDPNGTWIRSAVAIDSSLYVLWDAGTLVALPIAGGDPTIVTGGTVKSIAKDGSSLWTLELDRKTAEGPGNVRVYTASATDLPPLPAVITNTIGLVIVDHRPIVISENHLALWNGEEWTTTPLNLGYGYDRGWGEPILGVTRDNNTIYLGINRGEFGGRLHQIDISSGISRIASPGGVTSLLPDINNPDCMIIATGPAMVPHGAIYRYCTNSSETLFKTKLKAGSFKGYYDSLYSCQYDAEGTLIVSGDDGVFSVENNRYFFKNYEKPRQVGGLYLSEDVPGVLTVSTMMSTGPDKFRISPVLVRLDAVDSGTER